MTVLDETGDAAEATGVNISSIVDSWVLLRNDEIDGERVRMLSIVKSRGMAHSSKTHEFQISDQGIEFKDRSGEHCTA